MKKIANVVSYFLALMFLLSISQFFFHLFPEPAMEPGIAKDYSSIMNNSGYMAMVKVVELIGVILLLIPRFRALGLVILIPVSVNILSFEVFILGQPGFGILILALLVWLAYVEREKFKALF